MTDDLRAALYSCKRILLKLQMISDAPTAHLSHEPRAPQNGTSRAPNGVDLNANLTNGRPPSAPSKRLSLWAHYEWRMKRAALHENAPELLKLAACATRDYEVYQRQRSTHHPSHDEAVAELLRECVGMTAIEASWWCDAPLKWVKQQRLINGYDPEYGEPTERQSERTRRIVALAAAGMKHQQIADEVGLSRQRVQQVLAGG